MKLTLFILEDESEVQGTGIPETHTHFCIVNLENGSGLFLFHRCLPMDEAVTSVLRNHRRDLKRDFVGAGTINLAENDAAFGSDECLMTFEKDRPSRESKWIRAIRMTLRARRN